jgi:DNA primase
MWKPYDKITRHLLQRALSIIEGGCNAVGLGGSSNIEQLKQELIKTNARRPLIVCLDNDEAGKSATKKIIEFLKEKGEPFEDKTLEICGDKKDPNEALVSNRDEFINAVKDIIEGSPDVLQKESEAYKQENICAFRNAVSYFEKEKQVISTGFGQIDGFLK